VGDLCSAGGAALPAVAGFVGMWAVMMIPMMLPSLAPSLWHCRSPAAVATAGLGYFAVWVAFGAAAQPFDGMAARHPLVAGVVVVLAGAFQFTSYKARRLAMCASVPTASNATASFRRGLRLGIDCAARCVNLMAALVAVGAMDVAAMTLVTLAVTAERYERRMAKPIGVVVVAAGMLMVARTL